MIASAQTLRALRPLSPFEERGKVGGMSYGLGPASYDIRIAQDLLILPQAFVLGSTLEKFQMPGNLLGIVHDKSTWARMGLAVQNTLIDPGWTGYLTLELTNHGYAPVMINAGSPVAQIVFHLLDQDTEAPYDGKYQNQEAGPQEARLEAV